RNETTQHAHGARLSRDQRPHRALREGNDVAGSTSRAGPTSFHSDLSIGGPRRLWSIAEGPRFCRTHRPSMREDEASLRQGTQERISSTTSVSEPPAETLGIDTFIEGRYIQILGLDGSPLRRVVLDTSTPLCRATPQRPQSAPGRIRTFAHGLG